MTQLARLEDSPETVAHRALVARMPLMAMVAYYLSAPSPFMVLEGPDGRRRYEAALAAWRTRAFTHTQGET